jgi:hypothetical protein
MEETVVLVSAIAAKVMVWSFFSRLKERLLLAGSKVELPACDAVIVTGPSPTMVAVLPLMVSRLVSLLSKVTEPP